jgi:serine/threonine protein kinase
MHNLDPPYAHNDVKPGNVLLTHRKGHSPLAILMDFGSARPARKQIRSRSEALQLQVIIFYSLPFPFTLFWIIISYSFILIFHQYYFQQPS